MPKKAKAKSKKMNSRSVNRKTNQEVLNRIQDYMSDAEKNEQNYIL